MEAAALEELRYYVAAVFAATCIVLGIMGLLISRERRGSRETRTEEETCAGSSPDCYEPLTVASSQPKPIGTRAKKT